jgi:hypothetical protein
MWSWLRQRADRRRYAAQQVLADLYKYAADHGGATSAVPGVVRARRCAVVRRKLAWSACSGRA